MGKRQLVEAAAQAGAPAAASTDTNGRCGAIAFRVADQMDRTFASLLR